MLSATLVSKERNVFSNYGKKTGKMIERFAKSRFIQTYILLKTNRVSHTQVVQIPYLSLD